MLKCYIRVLYYAKILLKFKGKENNFVYLILCKDLIFSKFCNLSLESESGWCSEPHLFTLNGNCFLHRCGSNCNYVMYCTVIVIVMHRNKILIIFESADEDDL